MTESQEEAVDDRARPNRYSQIIERLFFDHYRAGGAKVYVGLDKRGAQYVVPTQAKRGRDKLSIVQVWQDIWMCALKFPVLVCRPVAAIQMDDGIIALLLFERVVDDLRIAAERHYRLVEPSGLTADEVRAHNASPPI